MSKEAKIYRLYDHDDHSSGETRPEYPAHRDPIYQLLVASIVFVAALFASSFVGGAVVIAVQGLVIAAGLLAATILLRSVRHGWNVSVYERAREAQRRESMMRMERNALREFPRSCVRLLSESSQGADAIDALQGLTDDTRRQLERNTGAVSVAIAEQVEGRFFVHCVAGYMSEKPYHVGPGKSCTVDRMFSELMEAFARGGTTLVEETRVEDRQFWIGVTCREVDARLDPQAPRVLANWVYLTATIGLLPRSNRELTQAG